MDSEIELQRELNLVRRGVQHGLGLEISKQEGLVRLARLGRADRCLTPEPATAL